MFTQPLLLRAAIVAVLVMPLTNSWTRADEKEEHSPGVMAIPLQNAPAEEKIRQALQEPTTVDFLDTPLEDVLNFIEDLHAIPVVVDKRALDDLGLDLGEPITIALINVSLRSALDLILRDLDLTFVIDSEVLMITSIEEAETMLSVMIYPVKDIIEPSKEDEDSTGPLIEVITTIIAPNSWSDGGGPGTIVGYRDAIAVSNTRHAHEEVLAFLNALRKLPRCETPAKHSGNESRPESQDSEDIPDPFADPAEDLDSGSFGANPFAEPTPE